MASPIHQTNLPKESLLLSLLQCQIAGLDPPKGLAISHGNSVQEYENDIPVGLISEARKSGFVAWDIETTGLDWQFDKIATCQIYVPGVDIALVRVSSQRPKYLIELLNNRRVVKVFHHAMFDLRFLIHNWGASPRNIVCTKVAAKLLDRENHKSSSLKNLLSERMGIQIDKSQQTSDWLAETLSIQQISYAATDVVYLPHLFSILSSDLISEELFELSCECFQHIPTRARLEVLGYKDVFVY